MRLQDRIHAYLAEHGEATRDDLVKALIDPSLINPLMVDQDLRRLVADNRVIATKAGIFSAA